jgi:hypothetical protein
MASDLDRHHGRMSPQRQVPPLVESKPPSVLRLLVVDDHEVVREGLVALLGGVETSNQPDSGV